MKRENLTKEQQDYFMLGFQYGQRKSISTVKLAAIAGMAIMFLFGMMVPVRCNAQNYFGIRKDKNETFNIVGSNRELLAYRKKDSSWVFLNPGGAIAVMDSIVKIRFGWDPYILKKASIDSLQPGKSDVPNKKPGSIYGPGTLSYYEATTPPNEINKGELKIVVGESGYIHPRGGITLVPIDPTYDTIPVTLLVRISGKPWAFFHDGWEVRKIDTLPGILVEAVRPGESVSRTYPNLKHSHLLYLDSRKRPVRKEWVVYQTFKR